MGSEMCIRDRAGRLRADAAQAAGNDSTSRGGHELLAMQLREAEPVSYTHLTLPTKA